MELGQRSGEAGLLAPPGKIFSAVGVSTGNAFDQLGASSSLLELEALDFMGRPWAPETNGVVRHYALRIVEHQATSRGGFIDKITSRRSLLIDCVFRHDKMALKCDKR